MRSDLQWMLGGCLLITMLGGSCRTPAPPPDPDGAKGQAVEISLETRVLESLDCGKGDCSDWYRFRVHKEGTLYLTGRSTQSSRPTQRFTLRLEDGFGSALDSLPDVASEARTLTRRLDEGVYLIGIDATRAAGSIIYEFATRFEVKSEMRSEPSWRPGVRPIPQPAEPVIEEHPPEPKYLRLDAEVLEVEGRMAEPTGVLIDMGSLRGAFVGLRGELLDGESLVAEIEIVNIYEEGSRARISLPLFRPITPAVRAVMLLPDVAEEAPTGGGYEDEFGGPNDNEAMDTLRTY